MKRSWHKSKDIAGQSFDDSWDTEFDGRTPLSNVHAINLDRIEADPQSRKHFDRQALQLLADNITEHGQLQPVRVRYDEQRAKYILIAGERRFRACKLAGLATLDCIVTTADEQTALVENILENAQRQDLRPIEQARAFQDLMTAKGWSGAELARNIQVDRSTISRALKLLNLPDDIQQQIESGTLSPAEGLRQSTKPKTPTKQRRRITREEKLATKMGTIIIKGRRLMTDDVLIQALSEALELVKQRQDVDQLPKAA